MADRANHRRRAVDLERWLQVLLAACRLAELEIEVRQAVVRAAAKTGLYGPTTPRPVSQEIERFGIVAEAAVHVAELHVDEQGAGAQLRVHLLEPIGLAHRLERGGDPADVVEAEGEVVQQHELADAVALGAGQRDPAPRRGLGLGVLVGGVEQHAEVGVVLDLARPVVEPQQTRLGGAHRVHALEPGGPAGRARWPVPRRGPGEGRRPRRRIRPR